MAITDILDAAQGGAFYDNAAAAAGVSKDAGRSAIAKLAPAIAAKLKAKAANDPEAFDALLDLLEEGGDSSDLDDVDAMTGAEALSDGAAILEDLYGSKAAASAALNRIAPGISDDGLEKISAISATSVLAALAAANASTLATVAPQAADTGGGSGGGIISMIIAALIKGLLQGARRQLAPRRRRRRYYYSTRRRRTTRRRTKRPGLDDIFADILGARR